jgi:long-chain acyl-CoA synthetase
MNIAHWLERAARVYPHNAAVSHGRSIVLEYAQLARRASALSLGMRRKLALEPGDRVALAMANSPFYVELLYAVWWSGLTAIPVNAKLHPAEAAYILDHSGAKACFVTPDLASDIGALEGRSGQLAQVIEAGSAEYELLLREPGVAEPYPARADDVAWLFYTSGTTGRPKGVMISHRNLIAMSLCYFADVDRIGPQDCVLHAAPMSHGSGMYNFPHVLRAANQIVPEHPHFHPAEIFALCEHFEGVAMFAAPTMVNRLIGYAREHEPGLRGLKTIVYGGGPMYLEDIKQALDVLGERLVQIYGQGECPMTITALSREHIADRGHPRWEARLGSVGVAQSAVEVMVADDHDAPLPSGEIGEVLVRGDVVMQGYWGNPEASAQTLRNGWLHTGDVGSFDADGFLTLRDRSKDLIISGGSNVYPREVEEVLLRHPAVAEASVVGRRHADWGEEIVAFVTCKPGAQAGESELDALCLQHIARFKRPRAYRFVDSLPKNNYGKVLKTELRARLEAEASTVLSSKKSAP